MHQILIIYEAWSALDKHQQTTGWLSAWLLLGTAFSTNTSSCSSSLLDNGISQQCRLRPVAYLYAIDETRVYRLESIHFMHLHQLVLSGLWIHSFVHQVADQCQKTRVSRVTVPRHIIRVVYIICHTPNRKVRYAFTLISIPLSMMLADYTDFYEVHFV